MGLEYDFDIVAVAPDQHDPEHGHSAVTGRRPVRALFRDVKTADALRAASPKIRRIFLESGFSLDAGRASAGPGVFSPDDLVDRNMILRRLFSNIRNMGVQGEYAGEFDFHQFLNHVRSAKPGPALRREQPRPSPPPRPAPAPPERRSVPGRIGFALGLAVIVFVILKYLAERGAAP